MIIRELFARLGFDIDGTSLARAESAIGVVRNALIGLGAIAGIHEVISAIEETANAAAGVAREAQKIGIGTTALQELKHAAEASGLPVEDLEQSLTLMARAAYAAANGNSEAGATFRKLGVGIRGANGQIRPAEELLGDLADRFAAMPDGVEKTALATHAFGRSGAQMIPFLNKGRTGIAELREEAERFGIVMDEDLIGRSKEYRKVNRELGDALEGLKLAFIGPLVHASALKVKLTELIVAAQPYVKKFMERGLQAMSGALSMVGKVAVAVGRAFLFLTEHTGVLMAVLAALAFALRVPLVAALGDVVLGLFQMGSAGLAAGLKAAGSALLAGAIWLGWAVVIAGLILLMEDLYVFLTGGDSLIGALAGKALKFYDDLTEHKADEWWVTGLIKEAYALLTDFQRLWNQIKADIFGIKEMSALQKGALAASENLKQHPDDPAAKANFAYYAGQMTASGMFGGGASSPADTAAAAPGGPLAPQFKAEINVTAGQGADGGQIGKDISTALDSWWDEKMGAAHAAANGGA